MLIVLREAQPQCYVMLTLLTGSQIWGYVMIILLRASQYQFGSSLAAIERYLAKYSAHLTVFGALDTSQDKKLKLKFVPFKLFRPEIKI